MSDIATRLVNFWTPRSRMNTDDPELSRQNKLVAIVGGIVFACAVLYGSIYAALGMWLTCAGAWGAGVLLIVGARGFRDGRDIHFVANVYSGAVALAITTILLGTGGHDSPASAWYALGPMLAMMLAGRRSGLRTVAPTILLLATIHLMSWQGWVPNRETPDWFVAPYALIVPIGLTLCLVGIAYSYEVSRNAAMSELSTANDTAQAAAAQARRAQRQSQLVLDTVAEGLVLVGADGRLRGTNSRAAWSLVGPGTAGQTVWSWLESIDPIAAATIELGWSDLESDWMPREMAIDQLPSRLNAGERTISVAYRPVEDDGELQQVLVVLQDITQQLIAREAANATHELVELFAMSRRDPRGLDEFLSEARELVARLTDGRADAADELRWLHTLKGSSAMVGLTSLPVWIHGLEDTLSERRDRMSDTERAALQDRWSTLEARLAPLTSDTDTDRLAVDKREWRQTIERLEQGDDPAAVARCMRRWHWDRADLRLDRLARFGEQVAQRLGKDHVRVEVEAEPLRTPPSPEWHELYGALVHAVRNAVDHGIEPTDERSANGKPGEARVTLRVVEQADGLVLEVGDDGRGIDWRALRDRARSLGLPDDDSLSLLFADGISSRDDVTEISGRGVGMAAIRSAVDTLGGSIEVDSQFGRGTRLQLILPPADPVVETGTGANAMKAAG